VGLRSARLRHVLVVGRQLRRRPAELVGGEDPQLTEKLTVNVARRLTGVEPARGHVELKPLLRCTPRDKPLVRSVLDPESNDGISGHILLGPLLPLRWTFKVKLCIPLRILGRTQNVIIDTDRNILRGGLASIRRLITSMVVAATTVTPTPFDIAPGHGPERAVGSARTPHCDRTRAARTAARHPSGSRTGLRRCRGITR